MAAAGTESPNMFSDSQSQDKDAGKVTSTQSSSIFSWPSQKTASQSQEAVDFDDLLALPSSSQNRRELEADQLEETLQAQQLEVDNCVS